MLKYVLIVGLTGFFCWVFGDTVKTNQDTPILSGMKMFAWDFSSCQCKVYVDICYGYRRRRRQLTVGWSKFANFNACSCHMFRTFKN